MDSYVYDCEVFAHDWVVVIKVLEQPIIKVIHNDRSELRKTLESDAIYFGFNNKNYDRYIIQAILNDFSPEQVKEVNDWIIGGNNGWEYPMPRKYEFHNADVMNDMQKGLSLKAIEAHLGMNIVESSVPFDLDRPLTKEELEETIRYCTYDVKATEKIVKLRRDYFNTKLTLGRKKGIPDLEALELSNAKLTAKYLNAVPPKTPRNDEREYKYPSNLLWEYIPQEVKAYYDRMADKSIPDSELWEDSLLIFIGGMGVSLGLGGIHGALLQYIETATDTRAVRIRDVKSFYPFLIINNGYLSRNVSDPALFKDTVDERIEAKANGDPIANDLKLVVNGANGATNDPANPLYDPLQFRSVCISGQLYLLELANHLHNAVESLRLIQLNTDGLVFSFDKKDEQTVNEIVREWEQRTRFELEEDDIQTIVQKDVNNYILVKTNGKVKIKGGYLVRGISQAGAFNINNNAPIVSRAIVDYIIDRVPVEETMDYCNDVLQYQFVAKASSKFTHVCHEWFDGFTHTDRVQKCNRVYASKDQNLGTLYSYKDTKRIKMTGLPEHCLIDNDNKAKITDIDKQFYIDLAKSRIKDFIGENELPTKKTPTTEEVAVPVETAPLNIYQKLLKARIKFLEANVKMSGKNVKQVYKYFELSDIVPVATKIFNEVGLIPIVSFDNEYATMTIYDTEATDTCILFTSPMREIDPIRSSTTGNEVINAMQRLGGVETYQRRYLYLMALDIVESDMFEADAKEETPKLKVAEAPKPVQTPTSAPKAEAPASPNANASQITQIKAGLKKLVETDKPYVQSVLAKTSKLTQVTSAEADALIIEIGEKLNG